MEVNGRDYRLLGHRGFENFGKMSAAAAAFTRMGWYLSFQYCREKRWKAGPAKRVWRIWMLEDKGMLRNGVQPRFCSARRQALQVCRAFNGRCSDAGRAHSRKVGDEMLRSRNAALRAGISCIFTKVLAVRNTMSMEAAFNGSCALAKAKSAMAKRELRANFSGHGGDAFSSRAHPLIMLE